MKKLFFVLCTMLSGIAIADGTNSCYLQCSMNYGGGECRYDPHCERKVETKKILCMDYCYLEFGPSSRQDCSYYEDRDGQQQIDKCYSSDGKYTYEMQQIRIKGGYEEQFVRGAQENLAEFKRSLKKQKNSSQGGQGAASHNKSQSIEKDWEKIHGKRPECWPLCD